MNIQPTRNISAEKAKDLLEKELPLKNIYITGEINLESNEIWEKEINIENCIIEGFSASVTQFSKIVKLKNVNFRNCRFIFTYFLDGLIIENCVFYKYLDFQAGGHNKSDTPVIMDNNHFHEFVNFFDCWYEGPFILRNNKFDKGTNIISKKQLITFDFEPIIENNMGTLTIERENI